MKKIEKSLSLATAYKKWLDNLNSSNTNHPNYNSSDFRFYKDIVANLLWVQKGLCAYTEMYLMDYDRVKPSEWKKGRFKKFDFMGQLDHYDSTLKDDKGWEWTNFFLVHSDVNVKVKGTKKVNAILKPDEATYNPFYYLEYDYSSHFFSPNKERDFSLKLKILDDINALGLNYQPISDYRKEYLKPIIDDVQLGKLTLVEARASLKKFFTSFEMSVTILELDA